MNDDKLYKKTLTYYASVCAARECCVFDIRQKMDKNGELDEQMKDRIIEELVREKFIDEERYCAAFVSDKARFNGWGPIKIRYELERKSLPKNMISNAIEDFDQSVFAERLTEHLRAKLGRGDLGDPKVRNKLLRAAAARGFSFDAAINAIERL